MKLTRYSIIPNILLLGFLCCTPSIYRNVIISEVIYPHSQGFSSRSPIAHQCIIPIERSLFPGPRLGACKELHPRACLYGARSQPMIKKSANASLPGYLHCTVLYIFRLTSLIHKKISETGSRKGNDAVIT